MSELPDSGKREEFSTGAVRDADDTKPRLDLISPLAMYRLGGHLRDGAKKYSARNWEKGIPQTRIVGSLLRHVFAYLEGDDAEDHVAAIITNAMFLAHNDEGIKRGYYPNALDDRPTYVDLNDPWGVNEFYEQGNEDAVATYTEHAEREFGEPDPFSTPELKKRMEEFLKGEARDPVWGNPIGVPMDEVQHSSTEQWSSQTVLHDPNHSESEGVWHFHEAPVIGQVGPGPAYPTKPSDIRSRPHTHRRAA